MEIKIIGAGCDKCARLYSDTVQVVETLQLDAGVEKVEDLMEIVRLGVMSAPSIMIDGKLVSCGRVLNKKEIAKLLQKYQ